MEKKNGNFKDENDMKIRRIIIAIAFFLASCLREDPVDEIAMKTFDCFTIVMDDVDVTKAFMGDGGSVKWNEWDDIYVFSDLQGPVRYYRSYDGKCYGDPISGTKFYAYWDNYCTQYNPDNPTVLTCNGGLQGAVLGQYIVFPLVAVSEGDNLIFRPTVGLLHIRLQSTHRVITVSLRGNSDESFCNIIGTIDLEETNPTLCVVAKRDEYPDSQSVGIPVEEQENGLWDIYFPVPEMSFEKGFTITIGYEENDSYFVIDKSTHKRIEFKRGIMKSFTLVELDQEIEDIDRLQREALIALYNSTDGDHWVNNTNWCSDKPINEWYGVETFSPYNEVGKLDLSYNNLNGTLPSEIGNLTHLHWLYLSGNPKLGGAIPKEIGLLDKLYWINFNFDNFSGPIPSEIGLLKDLKAFEANGNKLSGAIPKEVKQLGNIGIIDLSFNKLTGPLPEFSLNHTDGLDVSLDGNMITGTIPESYGSLSTARFRLCYNYLSGDVPESFQQLPFWDYHWPFLIAQRGKGFNMESLHLRGPKFSITATDGTKIDDSIYGKNEYTLLFEFVDDAQLSFYDEVYNLYCDYKKKGLEVIGYCGGVTNSELAESVSVFGFPWKNFRYDGASTISAFLPFDWDNPVFMLSNRYPGVNVVDRNGDMVFTPYSLGPIDIIDSSDGGYSINGNAMNYSIDDLVEFISNKLGEPDPFDPIGPDKPYESIDYFADGNVHVLQEASQGKGVNLVLMGDAYSDRLIADGTYQEVMQRTADAFFTEEPYKSFRDLFNVYYVDVVSKNETFYGETALETYYGGGTLVGGNNNKVFEYAQKAVLDSDLTDVLITVLMNRDYYAGTCNIFVPAEGDYARGRSISYIPVNSDEDTFNALVSHESGGHGFAKLADEYDQYQLDGIGQTIPKERVATYIMEAQYGFWRNVDFTSDPEEVKWSRFITDSRYQSESIGVYEGACTYSFGAYRPTSESIMNNNTGGFNAPSRYAIWYRINKLAYGEEWNGTYEDFVMFDLGARTSPAATKSAQAKPRNYVERQLPPLHPPVVVNKDWREVRK